MSKKYRQTSKQIIPDEDIQGLFPSQPFEIGSTIIHITPLSMEESTELFKLLGDNISELIAEFVKKRIDLSRIEYHIQDIVSFLVVRVPEILEVLSGIDKRSLKKLPLAVVVEIMDLAIKINCRDRDFFELLSSAMSGLERMESLLGIEAVEQAPGEPESESSLQN